VTAANVAWRKPGVRQAAFLVSRFEVPGVRSRFFSEPAAGRIGAGCFGTARFLCWYGRYYGAMSELTAEDRARRVKVLLFDVDGVLTNGDITIIPDGGGHGTEVKSFSAHDGMGISIARLAGLKIGFVTKRQSQVVAIRARDLKIDHVYQGQSNKLEAFAKVLQDEQCTPEEVAYVGDDIIDLPVMRKVGLAIAAANARSQVKAMAHWTTTMPGGEGAGRDAIDFILEAKGVLAQTIEKYLDPQSEEAKQADIGTGNM
jgi:3-deoxy-D-manno-octulosonate 8-phosphate phosphatase (KDO 8-P phosphatase)